MATTAFRPAPALRSAILDARTKPFTWVALAAFAVALIGGYYVAHLASFFVMTDEMVYFKASSDIWDGARLLHPGDTWFSTWGELAPLLRSPTFAFSTTTAFDLSHVLNAVAFASSAIPVYLLARRLLAWAPLAVLAAVLSISVPWLASSATMLAEPMTYPAFCWALFGMQRSVAAPSWRSDLLALAGIGLAFFGRTQLASLAPAFVLAILAHEVGWALVRPGGRPPARAVAAALVTALRRHVLLVAACVLGVLAVLAVGKDRVVSDLLGSYSQTAYGGLFPRGTRQDAQELLALIGIGTGVIPLALAAGWVLHAFARPEDRESHAFAAISLCVTVVLSVVAASFVVRFTAGPGLSERYLCYLAPILFIGMLKCLSLKRAPVTIALGGLFALWIYQGKVLYEAPGSALAPAAPPHTVMNARLHELLGTGIAPSTALGIAALAVALVLAVPRRLIAPRTTAITVGSLVLAFVGWQTYYTLHSIRESQKGAPASYLDNRDWVDQTLPKGVHAGAILAPIYDTNQTPRAWWEALFYNRTVRLSYKDMENSDQAWGQTQVQELTVNERTGVVSGLQNEQYVIRSTDDHRWVLEGAKTLRHFGNMLLQQLPPGPRRVPWTLRGSDETGVVKPRTLATLRVFRDPVRPLSLTLTLPAGAAKPATVRIDAAGSPRTVTVTATHPVVLRVRATPRPGAAAPQVRLRGVTNSAQIAVG